MTTTTTEEPCPPSSTAQQVEQEEALKEINAMLATSRPKNLRAGVGSGLSNIVQGAVGAVGIAVLAPTVGLAVGVKHGGILGAAVGVAGGAVIGVLGAGAMAVGGALSGVSQIVRGVAATPAAIMSPSQGKWWNEADGKWVLTDLSKDGDTFLNGVPDDDADLLGGIQKDLDKEATATPTGQVMETFYYDALELPPQADQSTIKRKYYVLARKYHPDKVDKDDVEAHDKFKEIAEAYQVLSDPELRAKYDKEGRGGLSADKTCVATDVPKLDPSILFAFLFGSDKFNDYIGRLAVATSASIGDSPKISLADARELQKRRVLRLALKLASKLEPWVAGDNDACKAMWITEAEVLSTASYGIPLIHLLGKVYNLAAVKFLGSAESGIGMPSIADWAARQQANIQKKKDAQDAKMDTLKTGFDMLRVQQKLQKDLETATTDEERKAIEDKLEATMSSTLLSVLWTQTTVDITTTIYEVVKMVCFDHAVSKDDREKRASGIKNLGEIFMEIEGPLDRGSESSDAKKLYEEAAFAAMLETIKRKEEATQSAKE